MSQTLDPTTGSSNNRPGPRHLWLIGGLAAALAIMVVCTVAVVAGLLLLRDRPEPAGNTSEVAATGQSMAEKVADPDLDRVNRIAFIDPRDRLGTVAPDGSDSRLLTQAGRAFQFPTWSPSGNQLAVLGSDGQTSAVFMAADDATSPLVELYSSDSLSPFYLYWSPDGRLLSFLANDPQGIALHLAPGDGSAASQVLATGQPFYWQWSADANRLLIHTGGLGESGRLAFIDTAGEAVTGNIGAPGLFQAPGISSSGHYLAFAVADESGLQLVVQDSQADRRTELPYSGLVALSWSPAADRLAFTSPRAPAPAFFGPLRVVDAETGNVRILASQTVLAFFWSPDGRSIAYLTREGTQNEPGAQLPRASGQDLPVSNPLQGRGDLLLTLSVVDVESGQRRQLATFRPTRPFVTQFMPYFDQYALSHRLWAPDSSALVMPMTGNDGQDRIYVVPMDGSAIRPVAEGSIGFWSQQ